MPVQEDANTTSWYDTNIDRYIALTGFSIPKADKAYRYDGDAIPAMNTQAQLEGHQVEGFVEGRSYFNRLLEEMDRLIARPTNGIFWIHGWCLQFFDHFVRFDLFGKGELPSAFYPLETLQTWSVHNDGAALRLGPNSVAIAVRLMQMEHAGVDVRVMGWVNPAFLKYRFANKGAKTVYDKDQNGTTIPFATSFLNRNLTTLYTVLELRETFLNATKVCFDTLSHPLGGAHAKCVICGNDQYLRGYTGGIDLMTSRNSVDWPDAAVAVEGPAARKMFEFFIELWNEVNGRAPTTIRTKVTDYGSGNVLFADGGYSSHFGQLISATAPVKAPVHSPTTDNKRVQMYSTLPRMNFSKGLHFKRWLTVMGLGGMAELTYAQRNDIGTSTESIPHVWSPKISTAANGRFEFKVAAYKAIKNAQKYIFIMDQDAHNPELFDWINKRILERYNEGVLLKVIIMSPYKMDIVNPYYIPGRNMDRVVTVDKPDVVNAYRNHLVKDIDWQSQRHLVYWGHYSCHSKVMIVDDVWASVGSANCQGRSFYTDIEMGVSIVHKEWVPLFRRELWATFCRSTANFIPADIDEALGLWYPYWHPNYDATNNADPSVCELSRTKVPVNTTFGMTFDHRAPFEERKAVYTDFNSNISI